MRSCLLLLATTLIVGACPAHADPVEDFYKGRTITVLIGYSPGGSYDAAGRVLAHYMGRHIPGSPSFVPQNMPGAGTLNLANYLYNVAPKDGSAFGIFARGMAMEPLIGGTNTKFDATKFTWIGSAANEISVCATYATSPVKTWNDALTKDFTVAGNGSGSDPDVFANVLRNKFGVRNRLISGYPGSAEISLAMERGEIDGRCGWSWSRLQICRRCRSLPSLRPTSGSSKSSNLSSADRPWGVPSRAHRASPLSAPRRCATPST